MPEGPGVVRLDRDHRAGEHQVYSEFGPPVMMPSAHWHSQVEINFLSSGSMTYLINGRLIRLPAGHIGVFWATAPHQVVDADNSGEIVVIYLPLLEFLQLPLPGDYREAIMRGGFLIGQLADPVDAVIFPRWHAELLGDDERLTTVAKSEILTRLQRMAAQQYSSLIDRRPDAAHAQLFSTASLERVRLMAEFIATQFQQPLRVREITQAAGLNETYAMGLFRKVIGVTVGEYLMRQRLGHAQALLVSTDSSVTDIALDSGFGSVSRFYAVFNQALNKTPRQYRREFSVAAAPHT